jgi:hypothetical protein
MKYLRAIKKSLFLLLLVFFPAIITHADNFDEITAAIKAGNYKGVAKFFSERVELRIEDKQDVYSKTQAELILKDFFQNNPPENFIVKHRGASAKGSQYVIGSLYTENGPFRTYFLFTEIDGRLFIQELHFEKD